MSDERLAHLAEAAGLAIDWVDANARPQRVTPEVLRAVLAGLGMPADSESDISASLHKLHEDEGDGAPPPLITLDQYKPASLPGTFAPGTRFRLVREDGHQHDGQLDDQGQLPAIDQVGYHRLEIGEAQITLAVAPSACPSVAARTGNTWGLTVQLYGLRRQGDGGLGDTEALEGLARHAAMHGADALAISPVHAMFQAYPEQYSPYSPSSRLFHNVLYSAPGSILGERPLRQAIEASGLASELARLESLDLIDWPVVTETRHRLLRELYREFNHGGHPLRADFDSFRQAGGEALENHCRFEALHGQLRAPNGRPQHWRDWPDHYRDPAHAAVSRFAQDNAEEVGYHAFGQWLVARGLERAQTAARSAGMRIGLVADLAVGADGGGSQAWSRQAELLASLSVGAPPDILNGHGQSWGISAFSPNGLRDNGFRAFIEMLRCNLTHAGGMRIDHVMGLQRLWVMPVGAGPDQGAYLNYPLKDMLRLLCLEAHRHDAIILGEDLGTIPDGLREELAQRNILGMRVQLFEGHEGRLPPPHDWSKTALATTSTHDVPTLAGWWEGHDIDWRIKVGMEPEGQRAESLRQREHERSRMDDSLRAALGKDDHPLDTQEALDASVRFLGSTPAPLVLLQVEDALGLREQANMPGITEIHPNWQRRYPGESTSLLDKPEPARRLALLADARRQSPGASPE
ncbi:4-alpha-glucanotransferase [Stutzerimonas tarimensis]|uniref:4-alpha-glucanotransferase n=1 Tax=Stutzerimonas tarimensis TaxID=1507735 RepID=A0ABV7T2X0_9GAMM